MIRSLSIAKVCSVALLTAGWCILWGEVTIANVVSGAVLTSVLVVSATGRTPARTVRPLALAQFIGLVLIDLVKSTVTVATEVLTPTNRTDEEIILVDPRPDPVEHPLLMVVAVTITPGTAVVDIDPDTGEMYLHLLHAHKADEVTPHVQRLNRLANAALPRRAAAGGIEPAADTSKRTASN